MEAMIRTATLHWISTEEAGFVGMQYFASGCIPTRRGIVICKTTTFVLFLASARQMTMPMDVGMMNPPNLKMLGCD